MSGAKKGQLQAQITADAIWQATFTSAGEGPTQVNVTTSGGTYYLADLITAFASALNAAASATWTVVGSLGESGTGRVTIDCDDPAWTLEWDHTNLRDVLGFTGDLTAVSAAQTGTKQAKGLFMPSCPKATKHGDGDAGDEIAGLLYTYAPDGTMLTINDSASKTVNRVWWSHLDRAKTRVAAEVYANASWQQYWRDTHRGDVAYFSTGAPHRLIWDADTPGTYTTYKLDNMARCEQPPVVPGWNGLYRLELELVKVP
jgi:hypothetical protein